MARKVVDIEYEHGDRLKKIEIVAKPRNLMIFQVCMPTTDSDYEEIEQIKFLREYDKGIASKTR